MVDSFLRDWKPLRLAPVIYFYAEAAQGPVDVLRHFVRQLILTQPDVKAFFDKHPNAEQLSFQDCTGIITELVQSRQSVTMVMDAVDECRPATGATFFTFIKMLEELSIILRNSLRPIKLFISSQSPEDWIEDFYDGLRESKTMPCAEASSNGQPQSDIRRFIEYEVNGWSRSQLLPKENNQQKAKEVKLAIIKTVARKAGRM